jgi:hypothetical protein
MNELLVKLLKFLSGKKSVISGILNLTSAFLVLKGVIDADTGAYISGLILLIFGSASYATGKLVYNK